MCAPFFQQAGYFLGTFWRDCSYLELMHYSAMTCPVWSSLSCFVTSTFVPTMLSPRDPHYEFFFFWTKSSVAPTILWVCLGFLDSVPYFLLRSTAVLSLLDLIAQIFLDWQSMMVCVLCCTIDLCETSLWIECYQQNCNIVTVSGLDMISLCAAMVSPP